MTDADARADCCSSPAPSADYRFGHEGEEVVCYTECLNCGATLADHFTFTYAEVVERRGESA